MVCMAASVARRRGRALAGGPTAHLRDRQFWYHSATAEWAGRSSRQLKVGGDPLREMDQGLTVATSATAELDELRGEDARPWARPVRTELRQMELEAGSDPGLDSLRLYLRSIGRVPLLTAGEEIALAKKLERG